MARGGISQAWETCAVRCPMHDVCGVGSRNIEQDDDIIFQVPRVLDFGFSSCNSDAFWYAWSEWSLTRHRTEHRSDAEKTNARTPAAESNRDGRMEGRREGEGGGRRGGRGVGGEGWWGGARIRQVKTIFVKSIQCSNGTQPFGMIGEKCIEPRLVPELVCGCLWMTPFLQFVQLCVPIEVWWTRECVAHPIVIGRDAFETADPGRVRRRRKEKGGHQREVIQLGVCIPVQQESQRCACQFVGRIEGAARKWMEEMVDRRFWPMATPTVHHFTIGAREACHRIPDETEHGRNLERACMTALAPISEIRFEKVVGPLPHIFVRQCAVCTLCDFHVRYVEHIPMAAFKSIDGRFADVFACSIPDVERHRPPNVRGRVDKATTPFPGNHVLHRCGWQPRMDCNRRHPHAETRGCFHNVFPQRQPPHSWKKIEIEPYSDLPL